MVRPRSAMRFIGQDASAIFSEISEIGFVDAPKRSAGLTNVCHVLYDPVLHRPTFGLISVYSFKVERILQLGSAADACHAKVPGGQVAHL